VLAAVSAASLAVDTGAGSELASSLETWEATVVDYDGDGDLDGNADGRSEFLVLNGVETSGPAQRIQPRFE
jgi:hypothetical protein